MEFGGVPSLEDFKPRSINFNNIYKNADLYNNPDNDISKMTAIIGRLYLKGKKPRWNLLEGRYVDGDFEWGDKVYEISNEFFKKAVTVSNNPEKFDREAVEILKPIDASADRKKLVVDVDKLIEDLEERDYEFPGSFIIEARKLEKELFDSNEGLEKLLEEYNLLKRKK